LLTLVVCWLYCYVGLGWLVGCCWCPAFVVGCLPVGRLLLLLLLLLLLCSWLVVVVVVVVGCCCCVVVVLLLLVVGYDVTLLRWFVRLRWFVCLFPVCCWLVDVGCSLLTFALYVCCVAVVVTLLLFALVYRLLRCCFVGRCCGCCWLLRWLVGWLLVGGWFVCWTFGRLFTLLCCWFIVVGLLFGRWLVVGWLLLVGWTLRWLLLLLLLLLLFVVRSFVDVWTLVVVYVGLLVWTLLDVVVVGYVVWFVVGTLVYVVVVVGWLFTTWLSCLVG